MEKAGLHKVKKLQMERFLQEVAGHHKTLDTVEDRDDGVWLVRFYATAADRDLGPSRATITLQAEPGTHLKVAQSTCLPTNDWLLDAAAYKRAFNFALMLQPGKSRAQLIDGACDETVCKKL